jgi:hypothetical protein
VKAVLAVAVLVGLFVRIAKPDDEPTFHTVTPDKDSRLAKRPGAQTLKIGVLTYYPNAGGGFTFLDKGDIAFYALPLLPTTYQVARIRLVVESRNGQDSVHPVFETVTVFGIGKSLVPFGGQTLYRGQMMEVKAGVRCRTDIPLAKWTRDSPNGRFQLSFIAKDNETLLKLTSIVPVLEAFALVQEKPPAHKPASPITYEVIASKAGSDYVFFQNGQRIAYSKGWDLFLCPSFTITPPLKTDTLILDAGIKGGRGWMPAYQRLQPRPFTVAQQEEIVTLLGGGRDPTDTGKRHQLTTDGVVRIVEPDVDPPPSPK